MKNFSPRLALFDLHLIIELRVDDGQEEVAVLLLRRYSLLFFVAFSLIEMRKLPYPSMESYRVCEVM